ncbi:MAG: hypothetical protein H6745_05535 [Deltaproteobacteria bacterium]|nr:hypothetical protein [Deltaproteobacteria bacterium]
MSPQGSCVRCANAETLRTDDGPGEADDVVARATQAALGDWGSDRALSPDVQDQLLRWREKREGSVPRRRAASGEHRPGRKKVVSAQARAEHVRVAAPSAPQRTARGEEPRVAAPSAPVVIGPSEPPLVRPRKAERVVAATVEVTSRDVPVFALPGEEDVEHSSVLGRALLYVFIAASAAGVIFGLATNL